ncbi:MAG: hypothetical protein ACI4XM_06895 [Candidatus Coprovivens sp.]
MTEKELSKYLEQFPSIEHFYNQTRSFKLIGSLFGKGEEVKKINSDLRELIISIKKYNDTFSDEGWIAYDSINADFIKRINEIFDTSGYKDAEKEIIKYYTNQENNFIINTYSIEEFRIRRNNLERAFENHYNGNYLESVVLFLTAIDGAVNDFTKSKGFFAEGTNVEVWDCLVGANDGLQKLQKLYNVGRNKTNTNPIYYPYRNGILHGRDLNYGNAFCSCKCVVLLMSVCDWMKNKNSENSRKEKYNKEINPPSITESIKKYSKVMADRKIIESWKRKDIKVGETIPKMGVIEDYKEYPYIQYLFEILNYWKNKNYGNLSLGLSSLFHNCSTKGKLALECRKMFENKELIEYSLESIYDQAISLKVVIVNIKYNKNSTLIEGQLKFGLFYEANDSKSVGIPELNNGHWTIIPQDIRILYK